VANSAPEAFLWKKGSNGITAKVPGLYRLVVGFFAAQVGVATSPRQQSGL
jgi:hypothetical protein